MLAVTALVVSPLVRLGPIDEAHVAALVASTRLWPPVAVDPSTMRVIDGVHRVAAAQRLGLTTIHAVFCPSEDLLAEALRRNIDPGLPLTDEERAVAVRELIRRHPRWPDRGLADFSGLPRKRVARLRMDVVEELMRRHPEWADRALSEASGLDHGRIGRLRAVLSAAEAARRIGRDGRARPIDPVATRLRIIEALQDSPGASIRAVAQRVGASHETVRDVRTRLEQGDDPLPPRHRARVISGSEPRVASRRDPERRWATDSAINSTEVGAELGAWLDVSRMPPTWPTYVAAVPLSRVYEVLDDARQRAEEWTLFAAELASRAGRSPSSTDDVPTASDDDRDATNNK